MQYPQLFLKLQARILYLLIILLKERGFIFELISKVLKLLLSDLGLFLQLLNLTLPIGDLLIESLHLYFPILDLLLAFLTVNLNVPRLFLFLFGVIFGLKKLEIQTLQFLFQRFLPV